MDSLSECSKWKRTDRLDIILFRPCTDVDVDDDDGDDGDDCSARVDGTE